MTTSTPNLGLVLYNSTTDSAEYFSNFRATIAGTSLTSNFYKIDTAYGSMQTEIDDIQAGAYFTLASYISANYYEATVTGITAYNTEMKIILSLNTASTGTVTLNINSLGIKSVMKINSARTPVNISAGELMVGKYYFFAYDGTRWVWVDSTSADQLYIAGTSGNVVTVNSDNTLLGTLSQSTMISQTIVSASSKSTPIDADSIGLVDSADSNALKETTFGNLKSLFLSYFNAIYPSKDGWSPVSDAWTYASPNTINIPSGGVSLYKAGMGVRIKQGAGYKYYSITIVADTLLTLTGGSDYTVANSAITDIGVTIVPNNAIGFPVEFNFDPSFSGLTGTILARFSYVGSRISGHIDVTSPVVSGAVSFTLPVPITSYTIPSSSRAIIGTLGMLDAGATVFLGNVILGGSATSAQFRAQNPAGSSYAQITALGASVPMIWTTSDSLNAEFSYTP